MSEEKLFEIIEQYANIPVESMNERVIGSIIEEHIKEYVDEIWTDKIGNLYALKKGEKQGMVMLSAHQDKVVSSNIIGEISGKKEDKYLLRIRNFNDLFEILNKKQQFFINSNSIEAKIEFNTDTPNKQIKIDRAKEIKVRFDVLLKRCYQEAITIGANDLTKTPSYHEYEMIEEELLNLLDFFNKELRFISDYNIQSNKRNFIVNWPKFSINNELVTGKLDDSLGIGVLTYLNQVLKKEEVPTILTVYTAMEEVGFHGAQYASGKIKDMEKKPDRIIVVDTTAFGELGNGPIIYKSCGGINFNEGFVNELNNIAKNIGIKCDIVKPETINDSTLFAAELKEVKTLALEIPIENMHSELERANIKDVIQTYMVLEFYIKNFS